MADLTRRRYISGVGAVLGGLLAAACGEVEVRYVTGPAGATGPSGAQGEKGSAGVAGAKGASGSTGKTIVVDKPVTKVVEKTIVAAPATKVVLWTGFWRGGNMSDRGTGWTDLTNRWNAGAGDRNITFVLQPVSGQGNNTDAKIISNYAAGTTPDLVHTAYWSGGLYGMRGMLPDLLTNFINADKQYAATLDDFFPHLLESSKWKGKLWSLPQETNADLPYTNLAIVRAAGLEKLKLGYNWNDLREYLKKIQETLGPGEKSGKWAMSGMMGNVNFINLLMQAGGQFYNKDRTKVVYNSAAGVEALEFVAKLIHEDKSHVPHGDWFKAQGKDRPSFRKGSVAMNYETSASRLVSWAMDIGGLDNMYVTPSPTNKQPFVATFGQNLFLYKTNTQQQEAQWKVMRWLTSTGPAAHYAGVTMFLPPRKSVLQDPFYKAVRTKYPQFETFIEGLSYAFRPFHPEFPQHYGGFSALAKEIWTKPGTNIKDGLEEAVRLLNAKMDAFVARNG